MENLELAKLVLKQIEAEPESHSQMKWVRERECGTVACIAGHTLLQAGYEPVFPFGKENPGVFRSRSGYCIMYSDSIEAAAREELGLTDREYYENPALQKGALFYEFSKERATGRFRALIKAEEARRATA